MSKILFRQGSSVNVQYKNQSLLSNRILMLSQISPLKLLTIIFFLKVVTTDLSNWTTLYVIKTNVTK